MNTTAPEPVSDEQPALEDKFNAHWAEKKLFIRAESANRIDTIIVVFALGVILGSFIG